jgi:hypothetical protein
MAEAKEYWKNILLIKDIWHTFRTTFSLDQGIGARYKLGNFNSLSFWMEHFETKLTLLPKDLENNLRKKISKWIESYSENSDKTAKAIDKELGKILSIQERQLSIIPKSFDKAKDFLLALVETGDHEGQVYDIYILLKNEIKDSFIDSIVIDWTKNLQDSLNRQRQDKVLYNISGPKYKFWNSYNYTENIDAISIYRFIETFKLGNFINTKNEIEEIFKKDIFDSETLWLISRSKFLPIKVKHSIQLSIENILELQEKDGYWRTSVSQSGEYIPGIRLTATAAISILRLSNKQNKLNKAEAAVLWLIGKHNGKGWSNDFDEDKNTGILNTLLCVQALKLSKIKGLDRLIKISESWLLSVQSDDGTWTEGGTYSYPFLTTLILEHFISPEPLLNSFNNYQMFARGLFIKSLELLDEDNSISVRMAIIAAFQGLEALSYACLTHSNVKINIWTDNKKNETIGLSQSIGKLQEYYQRKKLLNPGENFEYKADIDRIIYLRNEIVHKALNINPSEVEPLIESSIFFGNHLNQTIFGNDLI